MQIRMSKSGRKIELLRSIYVPEKKRSSQNMVASFDYLNDQVPENILETLNETEQKEVQEWFNKRTSDRKESYIKQKVAVFSEDIDTAIEGITKYGITHDQAQSIYTGIDRLAKAIRQAGYTRLKKEQPINPSLKTSKKQK